MKNRRKKTDVNWQKCLFLGGFAITAFFFVYFFLRYLKYDHYASQNPFLATFSVVISIVVPLIAEMIGKKELPWRLKQVIRILPTMGLVCMFGGIIFFYPRSVEPEVYELVAVPNGSTGAYRIEAETNLSVGHLKLYTDAGIYVTDASEFRRSNEHSRIFTFDIAVESKEAEQIFTVAILLPNGELLNTGVKEEILPTLKVKADWSMCADSGIAISAYTSHVVAGVEVVYSTAGQMEAVTQMATSDGQNWEAIIFLKEKTEYIVSITARTADGRTAETQLTMRYVPEEEPREPHGDNSTASQEPQNGGETSEDTEERTVTASCKKVDDWEDLSELLIMGGTTQLRTDTDAVIVAETSFEASGVELTSVSETASYGPFSMESSDGRHWFFSANFTEESVFLITITAYASDGSAVTDQITVTFPFS